MVRMAELDIPATIWAVLNAPIDYDMEIVRPMLSEVQMTIFKGEVVYEQN